MRLFTLVLVATFNFSSLVVRVPQWQSNASVWTAATISDPQSPSALVNAGRAIDGSSLRSVDGRSLVWLEDLLTLPIPAWLPDQERQGYVQGRLNLAIMVNAMGDKNTALAIALGAIRIAPAMFAKAPKPWAGVTQTVRLDTR